MTLQIWPDLRLYGFLKYFRMRQPWGLHAAQSVEVVPSTTVLATDRYITLAPKLITELEKSGLETPSQENLQTLNALPENIQGSFLKGLLLPEGAKVETYPVIENLTNFMKAFFVTTVFDQMETVSLPKYPGSTPDNRKTRADNHLKVYLITH